MHKTLSASKEKGGEERRREEKDINGQIVEKKGEEERNSVDVLNGVRLKRLAFVERLLRCMNLSMSNTIFTLFCENDLRFVRFAPNGFQRITHILMEGQSEKKGPAA